jgi:hypothetical protein
MSISSTWTLCLLDYITPFSDFDYVAFLLCLHLMYVISMCQDKPPHMDVSLSLCDVKIECLCVRVCKENLHN